MAMAMASMAPVSSLRADFCGDSSSGLIFSSKNQLQLQLPRLKAGSMKLSTSRFVKVRAGAAPVESEEAVEESGAPGALGTPGEEVSAEGVAPVISEDLATPSLALPQQKIRVKLRAYFGEYVESAAKMIVEAVTNTGAGVMGPVPLPTERKIFCVLRSPHVDKDSREHFEIRTHKRLIDIKNPNARTIDALMKLDIPAGVDVEVKL